MLIGENINIEALLAYIAKGEELIERKIRYLLLLPEDFKNIEKEYPARLLLFSEKF